jgi:hypothetical protein
MPLSNQAAWTHTRCSATVNRGAGTLSHRESLSDADSVARESQKEGLTLLPGPLQALDDMVRKSELPPDRAALLKSKVRASPTTPVPRCRSLPGTWASAEAGTLVEIFTQPGFLLRRNVRTQLGCASG